MNYKEMIEKAHSEGRTDEDIMWKSVGEVCKLLKFVKETDPVKYHKFMRNQHELYYGPHYDWCFAEEDTSKMCYTDRDGVERKGPHWTISETTAVTNDLDFPEETTKEDIFVALNASYADLCRKFSDQQIIDFAVLFFFSDEDWNREGKIWRYMSIDR